MNTLEIMEKEMEKLAQGWEESKEKEKQLDDSWAKYVEYRKKDDEKKRKDTLWKAELERREAEERAKWEAENP